MPKLAGYYRKHVEETIEDIADQLATGTCACGTIASVKKELQAFLEMNPKASLADKVRARREALQQGGHAVRENCTGGT